MNRSPTREPPAAAPRRCRGLRWCGFALLALAILGTTAPAEPHTFTDTSGRTMVAEIMDATDTSVRVRRDDGRVFAIDLGTLSAADRAYINEWRTKRDFAFGGVEVSARRVRLDADRTQTRSSTKIVEDWCYKLTITNQSRADLDGLTVEYRVFYVDDTAQANRSELPLKRRHGRASVATIAAGATAEVQTTIVALEVTQLKAGRSYSGTGKRRVEDALAGIWVRVLQRGNVLCEWADPSSLLHAEAW